MILQKKKKKKPNLNSQAQGVLKKQVMKLIHRKIGDAVFFSAHLNKAVIISIQCENNPHQKTLLYYF